MSLLGLLMPFAGLFKRPLKTKADIDSSFFKLHYRTTATILFISSCLVTANNLIGDPIDCLNDTIPTKFLNKYCWSMSTFSVLGTGHKLIHFLSY